MKKTLVLFLLLAAAGFGQTAKVIQLKPADASEAKSLSENLKKAQADLEAFRKRVQRDYLTTDTGESECMSGSVTTGHVSNSIIVGQTITGGHVDVDNGRFKRYLKGWGCGDFEYSDDYRFIVPKSQPVIQEQPKLWFAPAPFITSPHVTW